METNEFKATMERVVAECFPDETLVFAECSDELIADVFAGRDIRNPPGNAGEFAWIEEMKIGVEIVNVILSVYKVWKNIGKSAKGETAEELRSEIHLALAEAGVSAKKIEHVENIVLSEMVRVLRGK